MNWYFNLIVTTITGGVIGALFWFTGRHVYALGAEQRRQREQREQGPK
jgi:hypothetical protein